MANEEEKPKDLMITDANGNRQFDSRLLDYISKGDCKIDNFIPLIIDIKNGIQVDASGQTLLHHAIEYNNLEIAKLLIKTGYSIFDNGKYEKSPLDIGLEKKNNRMLLALAFELDEMYIDSDFGIDWFRLILNVDKNDIPIFCKVMTKVKITSGDDIELARKLVKEGCGLCYTPKMKIDFLVQMINAGSDINAQDASGNTALHWAVRLEQRNRVTFLLRRNASVNIKNNKGQIPINCNKLSIYEKDENREILKKLIRSGSNLTDLDANGKMQIHKVLVWGPREVVEIALNSNNLDFFAQDGDGETIAHYLANNKRNVFDLMASKKYNPNAKNRITAVSPLHYAAGHMNLNACKILLEKGAKVNANSDFGTPLFLVVFFRLNDDKIRNFLELFLEHNANAQCLYELIDKSILDSPPFEIVDEMVLGHLALLQSLGKATNENQSLKRFQSDESYNKKYELCNTRLKEMKNLFIYEGITLFQMLAKEKYVIVGYMNNKDLLKKIRSFNDKYLENYYCNKKFVDRINNAIELAQLKEKGSKVLLTLIDSDFKPNTDIVRIIITYLPREDLINLNNTPIENDIL